jgi:hypothetical protein
VFCWAKHATRDALRLGDKVPGKKGATYGKYFVSGIICEVPIPLGIRKEELQSETVPCDARGKRGSAAGRLRLSSAI